MTHIAAQIRDAFEKSERSVRELLEQSGLDMDRSSLQRKLAGQQSMRVEEAEALARALGIEISYGREERPT